MRARKHLVLMLAWLFLLSGCFTVGRNFPGAEAVKGIQNGKTTKLEILNAFGTPYQTGVEDGDEKWTYFYSKPTLFKVYSKDLVIWFDKDNVVKSYAYSNNFREPR